MATTTSTLKIPYPLPGDRIADYPTVAKATAEAIERVVATRSTALTPSGWVHRHNSAALQKVGKFVMFSGANYSVINDKQFSKGGMYELGTLIPSGYRPTNEVHLPSWIHDGWGIQIPAVIGIRSNGSLFVIPGGSTNMTMDDQYHVLIVPPATWSTN